MPALVNKIKKHTLEVYRNKIKTKGFVDGETPEKYFEENCALGIGESCSKFVYKFFIRDFLEEKISEQKIVCLAAPKLVDIKIHESGAIDYKFKLSTISNIAPDHWEKINFNSPRRKLYKDLDRQADFFLKAAEEEKVKPGSCEKSVQDGDWVYFSVLLLNNNNQPAIRNYKNSYWIKIDVKYVVTEFHKIFLGRKNKECFLLDNLPEVGWGSDLLSLKGKFRLTINDVVKSQDFSIDRFKKTFYLDKNAEVHEKLIEIFSFRNDISQRRLIIEEAFRVLFNKIKFEIPKYLILRNQERLLTSIRKLPDYPIYKMSENFSKQVLLLSEKQVKEEALMRQIGYNEGVEVEHEDVLNYLNLFNHPRLIEFIYFWPNIEYSQDICLPLKESAMKLAVLKEKVLNFVIKRLSCRA